MQRQCYLGVNMKLILELLLMLVPRFVDYRVALYREEDGTLQVLCLEDEVLPEEVDMIECYGTCHAFTWFNIAYCGEVVLDE